jgi:hypothetical protein
MIIAALGTAASIAAEREQANDRRAVLNRQFERDEQTTNKATGLVEDQGQRYNAENRLQGLQDREQENYAQAQADIDGAGGASIGTAATDANTSSDFLKTKAARTIEEGTRLSSIARAAAKYRAPGQLQMDDSLSNAGLANSISNLWGSNQGMGRATTLDAQNVQQPLYGSLGRIATAVGGAMGSSGINFGGG